MRQAALAIFHAIAVRQPRPARSTRRRRSWSTGIAGALLAATLAYAAPAPTTPPSRPPAMPPAAAATPGPAPGAPAAAPAASTGKGVHVLYLVRHGLYNDKDPRDAAVGKALIPIGVAQARLAGARLRGLPFTFDEIQASPLTRARETAEVIASDLPGVPLRIVPDLAECTPPTRRADIMASEKPEDLAACAAQIDRLAAALFVATPQGDRRDLVVCHGNIIRSLVMRALGVDPIGWLTMSVGNGSLTVLAVEPSGSVRVLSVGDVGHLPPSLQTGSLLDPPRELVVPHPAVP